MIVITLFPALIALIAGIVYLAFTSPSRPGNQAIAELARLTFTCAMLVTLWTLGAHVVRFG